MKNLGLDFFKALEVWVCPPPIGPAPAAAPRGPAGGEASASARSSARSSSGPRRGGPEAAACRPREPP